MKSRSSRENLVAFLERRGVGEIDSAIGGRTQIEWRLGLPHSRQLEISPEHAQG